MVRRIPEGRGQRIKYASIAFTAAEKEKLDGLVKATTCRSVSEYVRKVCLLEPVVVYYRDRSLDDLVDQLILIRKELMGNPDTVTVGEINSLISKIADHVCKDHLFEKRPGDHPVP